MFIVAVLVSLSIRLSPFQERESHFGNIKPTYLSAYMYLLAHYKLDQNVAFSTLYPLLYTGSTPKKQIIVPAWLKNCWLLRISSTQTNKRSISVYYILLDFSLTVKAAT